MPPPTRSEDNQRELLELHFGASFLKGSLSSLCGLLVHCFANRAWSTLHEILGLLEAKLSERTHSLDNCELLIAHLGKHDIKLGLLFCFFSSADAILNRKA